jgi:hypothetical protein
MHKVVFVIGIKGTQKTQKGGTDLHKRWTAAPELISNADITDRSECPFFAKTKKRREKANPQTFGVNMQNISSPHHPDPLF